jgi:ribosomal protein S18 acetylase RimI-like enzyme
MEKSSLYILFSQTEHLKQQENKIMSVQIRRAVKKDCARLLELVNELALYEKAPQEVTVTLEHFEESGFGEKPVWWAFVATSPSNSLSQGEGEQASDNHEVILGFALYYIRYSTWKGQRMYLEDILVTEEARGKGIGKLLMDQLIAEAKERKLNGIVWQVLEWNEPAINFYKKYNAGFDAEWVNCSIPA